MEWSKNKFNVKFINEIIITRRIQNYLNKKRIYINI